MEDWEPNHLGVKTVPEIMTGISVPRSSKTLGIANRHDFMLTLSTCDINRQCLHKGCPGTPKRAMIRAVEMLGKRLRVLRNEERDRE